MSMSTIWKPMTRKEEWVALFPINPTNSYVSSGEFIKRLTVIEMSTIAFHRRMYPEHCFERHKFFDNEVTTMKPSTDPTVDFLISSLDSAFHAFDRSYLRKLVISLYRDANKIDSEIESYYFNFKYYADATGAGDYGDTSQEQMAGQLDAVQMATRRLLDNTISTSRDERPLPPAYEIVVRLYYNSDAPLDYQPPGFEEETEVPPVPAGEDLVRLGEVCARHHRLSAKKFSVGTARSGLSPARPISEASATPAGSRTSGSGGTSLSEVDVRCPCVDVRLVNPEKDQIDSPLIECQQCRQYQHNACFGLLADDDLSQAHCCESCALDRAGRCSAPELVAMRPRRAAAVCMFRRTLEWCTRTRTRLLTGRMLQHSFIISDDSAAGLLGKLEAQGVVRPVDEAARERTMETEYAVNGSTALKVMPKYFKGIEQESASLSDKVFQQFQLSSQETNGDDEELPAPPLPAAGSLPPQVTLHQALQFVREQGLCAPWGKAAPSKTKNTESAKQFLTALPPQPMEEDAPLESPMLVRRGGGRGRGRGRASKRRAPEAAAAAHEAEGGRPQRVTV